MSTKDIKELVEMATTQYRDKIIGFIKQYGTINTHIKTYRFNDCEEDIIPIADPCVITKIENGKVYYEDNVYDDLDELTLNELYNIINKM